jgi:hypothetical protein
MLASRKMMTLFLTGCFVLIAVTDPRWLESIDSKSRTTAAPSALRALRGEGHAEAPAKAIDNADRKLGQIGGDSSGSDQRQHTAVLKPWWPAKPFELACPIGTDKSVCDSFGNKATVRARCFEPEPQTQEVLSSFLTNCPECLYIDVGCNIGYFAAQAAMLGAKVECYEPTPLYTAAHEVTRSINGISVDSWAIHNVAIARR